MGEIVILVVTQEDDYTADFLILELHKRGSRFIRFNTDRYPSQTEISWNLTGSRTITVSGKEIDLTDLTSIWYRRPTGPTLSETPRVFETWILDQAREGLMALWRTTDVRWVNHPDANYVAGSKAEQLTRARGVGLEVPPTLITNVPEKSRSFIESANGDVVCKSVKESHLIHENRRFGFFTTRVSERVLQQLDNLGPEPYLFQHYVDKSYDVRVTVVGEDVFAVRILSQTDANGKVDWRRAARELPHQVESLPASVEARCVTLVRDYGLLFGAIDLVRRRDGEYLFLELNPNGQWAWIEQLTGLPLSSKLADLLDFRNG
jgi:glutathione synthase/RimK-type ligase-like ATP-grasp enzyme